MSDYVAASVAIPKVAHQYDPHTAPIRVSTLIARRAGADHNPFSGAVRIGVCGLFAKVAYGTYPDFSWLGETMFLDSIVFPYDIGYDSEGAEVFQTDVNTAQSGYDQRVPLWNQPLMDYNVAYGVRTMEQLHALKALFRVVRGQGYGFRFRDPMDYTSSFAMGEEARAPDPVTPFDQLIADGDGTTETFQLIKTYQHGTEVSVRKIIKPEHGTVRVAVGGVEIPPTGFTVDHARGVVTFVQRDGTTLTNPALTRGDGGLRTIAFDAAPSGWTLVEGDMVQVSGFSAPANSVSAADAWEVVSQDEAGGTITFRVPDGANPALGVDETAPDGTTVTLTPAVAPPLDRPITAGFLFHVPVRFSTDRLPVTLDAYGIGTATEVKLVEIREHDDAGV